MTPRHCPACGVGRDRLIGVEVWNVYDGVLWWRCRCCRHQWHRWPAGDWRHEQAAALMPEFRKVCSTWDVPTIRNDGHLKADGTTVRNPDQEDAA